MRKKKNGMRENREKEEQDSVTSTKIKRCEQRLGRYERSVTQFKIVIGRFKRPRTNRTEIKRLLRTFRRDENVCERRDRFYRIRVWIFGN